MCGGMRKDLSVWCVVKVGMHAFEKVDLVRDFLSYRANMIDLAETVHAAVSETMRRSIFAISTLSFGVRTREI